MEYEEIRMIYDDNSLETHEGDEYPFKVYEGKVYISKFKSFENAVSLAKWRRSHRNYGSEVSVKWIDPEAGEMYTLISFE